MHLPIISTDYQQCQEISTRKLKIDLNLKNGSEWKTFGAVFFVPLLSDSPHRDSLHRPRPFLSEWGCAVEREDNWVITRSA